MANGRSGGRKRGSGNTLGQFVAIPHDVLDSPAYGELGYPARALLVDVARQYCGRNNGQLLITKRVMAARGWASADVLFRAKQDLLRVGLLHETVIGARPNRAAWYALTWLLLDINPGFDAGAAETFERGSYRKFRPEKITPLIPAGGLAGSRIAPACGIGSITPSPADGAIRGGFGTLSTPVGGIHLNKAMCTPNSTDRRTA